MWFNITQRFDVNKQDLFKVHIPFGAGIGNTLKGFISGLSINPNTKLECNPRYILGNFDTVLESKHILNASDINNYNIEPFSSCRFLILKSEENIQKDLPYEYSDYNNVDLNNKKFTHLFTPKVTIDHSYDRSLIHDDVYNRIMKAITQIKFQPIIYDELNKYNIDFNTSMGISVRTWTASHEYNIRRKYSTKIYKNAIDAMITQNPNIKTVVLSLDNEIVEREYMQILNAHPGLKVIIYRETNVNHLQYVIIKMLLLSKCGYFICNRISTFSELVYWFGGCKQKINALM
jgi:hypothetical protein